MQRSDASSYHPPPRPGKSRPLSVPHCRRQRRAAPPTDRPGNPVAFTRGWNALSGGGTGGRVLPLRAARLKNAAHASACKHIRSAGGASK